MVENLMAKDNGLNDWIKNVILKYCPISEDRYDALYTYPSPEIDIEMLVNDDNSLLTFCFGNSSVKMGVLERASINGIIGIETIIDLIDFLIDDHEIISFFDLSDSQTCKLENTLEFKMQFSINWSDKSLKGLSVNKINLQINFDKNCDKTNEYLMLILNKYRFFIEKSESYQRMKDKYVSQIKAEYFNSLGKEDLLNFICMMSEDEIRDLLLEVSNDLFEKYFYSISGKDIKKYERTM